MVTPLAFSAASSPTLSAKITPLDADLAKQEATLERILRKIQESKNEIEAIQKEEIKAKESQEKENISSSNLDKCEDWLNRLKKDTGESPLDKALILLVAGYIMQCALSKTESQNKELDSNLDRMVWAYSELDSKGQNNNLNDFKAWEYHEDENQNWHAFRLMTEIGFIKEKSIFLKKEFNGNIQDDENKGIRDFLVKIGSLSREILGKNFDLRVEELKSKIIRLTNNIEKIKFSYDYAPNGLDKDYLSECHENFEEIFKEILIVSTISAIFKQGEDDFINLILGDVVDLPPNTVDEYFGQVKSNFSKNKSNEKLVKGLPSLKKTLSKKMRVLQQEYRTFAEKLREKDKLWRLWLAQEKDLATQGSSRQAMPTRAPEHDRSEAQLTGQTPAARSATPESPPSTASESVAVEGTLIPSSPISTVVEPVTTSNSAVNKGAMGSQFVETKEEILEVETLSPSMPIEALSKSTVSAQSSPPMSPLILPTPVAGASKAQAQLTGQTPAARSATPESPLSTASESVAVEGTLIPSSPISTVVEPVTTSNSAVNKGAMGSQFVETKEEILEVETLSPSMPIEALSKSTVSAQSSPPMSPLILPTPVAGASKAQAQLTGQTPAARSATPESPLSTASESVAVEGTLIPSSPISTVVEPVTTSNSAVNKGAMGSQLVETKEEILEVETPSPSIPIEALSKSTVSAQSSPPMSPLFLPTSVAGASKTGKIPAAVSLTLKSHTTSPALFAVVGGSTSSAFEPNQSTIEDVDQEFEISTRSYSVHPPFLDIVNELPLNFAASWMALNLLSSDEEELDSPLNNQRSANNRSYDTSPPNVGSLRTFAEGEQLVEDQFIRELKNANFFSPPRILGDGERDKNISSSPCSGGSASDEDTEGKGRVYSEEPENEKEDSQFIAEQPLRLTEAWSAGVRQPLKRHQSAPILSTVEGRSSYMQSTQTSRNHSRPSSMHGSTAKDVLNKKTSASQTQNRPVVSTAKRKTSRNHSRPSSMHESTVTDVLNKKTSISQTQARSVLPMAERETSRNNSRPTSMHGGTSQEIEVINGLNVNVKTSLMRQNSAPVVTTFNRDSSNSASMHGRSASEGMPPLPPFHKNRLVSSKQINVMNPLINANSGNPHPSKVIKGTAPPGSSS